jgi:two-component system response regulator ResD
MSAPTRILIVDDDPSFSESSRDLLEAYGYEVATAPDGRTALAKATAFRPDLVILDVMMTYSTEGFEVARELKGRPGLEDVGILLVTGMVRELNLPGPPTPDAEWLPVDRVLEKPIDPARLIAEVERVLQKHKKGEQT